VTDNPWRGELEVHDTFEITGRGTAYIVTAYDPPLMVNDLVLMGDKSFRVTSVEMRPTATPQYVVDGKQAVLLKEAPWETLSSPEQAHFYDRCFIEQNPLQVSRAEQEAAREPAD